MLFVLHFDKNFDIVTSDNLVVKLMKWIRKLTVNNQDQRVVIHGTVSVLKRALRCTE